MIIFGHLHKRFYYEPMKIYCTGCWLPTLDEDNDTGYVIIIDDQKENPFTAMKHSSF